MLRAKPGVQQAKVVVDLGNGGERAAWPGGGGMLRDAKGRRQALDQVDVGPLHLLEQGAGLARQCLEVAPTSLGVDRVEGERAFPGAAHPGEHGKPAARQVEVQTLQVVRARPTDAYDFVGNGHELFLDRCRMSGQVYCGHPDALRDRAPSAGQPGGPT